MASTRWKTAVALASALIFSSARAQQTSGGDDDDDSIAPLSVPPSLYWDGDDGEWSTFHVQVGGQTLRLLPSTSTSAGTSTWVVIDEGCSAANPDLDGCSGKRGYLFSSNESSTWSTERLGNSDEGALYNLYTSQVESKLGLDANAAYGFDTLTLGLDGEGLPTLQDQTIAGFADNTFFLGALGLSPMPFNLTSLNDPLPSMMGTLRNQSLIPGMSWAYTAGARYNDPPVFGSLTLGGHDTTRYTPNNATFSFGADFSRDLLVRLDSIEQDMIGSSPLLANGIDIFLDSLVPQIWLPVESCRAFEQAFNLTWNDTAELYLIDDQTHSNLLAQNPTFTFTLSQAGGSTADTDSDSTVSIELPYAAFDLEASPPLIENTTRYFPLRQAQNDSQYILGRTFFQQAYIIADFDRRNFSVSQALFPSTDVNADIKAIHPPSSTSSSSSSSSSSLSGGAIAGIVIGTIAGLALLALATFLLLRHRRLQNTPAELPGTSASTAEKRTDAAPPHSPAPWPPTPAHHSATPQESDSAALQEVHGTSAQKSELAAGGVAPSGGIRGRQEMGVGYAQDGRGYAELGAGGWPAVELEAPHAGGKGR